MSRKVELEKTIINLIKRYGKEKFIETVNQKVFNENQCLTIVSNKGMHPLPSIIARGEIYYATIGNLDFSSEKTIKREIKDMLVKLHKKLNEKPWNEVYLVMHGHPILHIYIKLLVYRVLGTETIDWFYNHNVGYIPIKMSIRDTLLD